MGGEPQLVLALGKEEASRRLRRHRERWVREEDFKWLAAVGANAVRLPVGWWALTDTAPEEFVDGAGAYLEKVSQGRGGGGEGGILSGGWGILIR